MLPEMFASMLHVPGRCLKPRGLPPLLLCRLGLYREAYGNDNTSTVSYRHTGEKHTAAFWVAPKLVQYPLNN